MPLIIRATLYGKCKYFGSGLIKDHKNFKSEELKDDKEGGYKLIEEVNKSLLTFTLP